MLPAPQRRLIDDPLETCLGSAAFRLRLASGPGSASRIPLALAAERSTARCSVF